MFTALAIANIVLILFILAEAFETIVQPRRVTHGYRFTRLFYRQIWRLWRTLAGRLAPGRRREAFLSIFGPMSILALFGTWVVGLIFAFALLPWSLGTPLRCPDEPVDFGTYLYMSGVTFFTLGYGDVTPATWPGRLLAVTETGMGFGFLAIIIGYLPVLYQAFSTREATISMLDARAGSPPSTAQLLLRVAQARDLAAIRSFLAEWERWASELLSSHLSFPVLSYYRSQHDNQSWLAALTMILDTCALLIVAVSGADTYQAQLTFAMARHAAVDLALVFRTAPLPPDRDRLPGSRLQQLRELLVQQGLELREEAGTEAKLAELRAMYEPFVNALAQYLLFTLPPILPERQTVDNWQSSAWTRRVAGIGKLPGVAAGDEHFD
jgi:hypothetical protein